MPEELWTEVHNTVQEAVMKIILKEKKFKKENGGQRKSYKQQRKEEMRESHTHLNAEFQRIARKDKETFISVLGREF